MIDFQKELKKYQPLPEADGAEEADNQGDAKDMMELLQYLFASQKGKE
ncbi:MAG: hypothetical protein FWE21_02630 [Defluviitaleaceae bacterium]|nr:hypothetical protein [Defluviitaleaceae bacterium]